MISSLPALCRANSLEIFIPGHPVSANHRLGWSRGRAYKTEKAESWESLAITCARRAAVKLYNTADLSELKGYPLYVEVDICRRQWTGTTKATKGKLVRPDLDNFIKGIFDPVLEGALGMDDSAVEQFLAKKVSGEDPCVKLRIKFL